MKVIKESVSQFEIDQLTRMINGINRIGVYSIETESAYNSMRSLVGRYPIIKKYYVDEVLPYLSMIRKPSRRSSMRRYEVEELIKKLERSRS